MANVRRSDSQIRNRLRNLESRIQKYREDLSEERRKINYYTYSSNVNSLQAFKIITQSRQRERKLQNTLNILLSRRSLLLQNQSNIKVENFKKKVSNVSLTSTNITKSLKKYATSTKSFNLARKTSFYYVLRRNYFTNPYKTPQSFIENLKSLFRFSFLGSFLNKYDDLLKLSIKNPNLYNFKRRLNSIASIDKHFGNFQKKSDISLFLYNFLEKSIDRYFPGKYGSTPRLIKAWIKRKMIYGESGFKRNTIKQLSYGGYSRKYKLGLTYSTGSTLSERRRIRNIRRGFRKGGGYRRFV